MTVRLIFFLRPTAHLIAPVDQGSPFYTALSVFSLVRVRLHGKCEKRFAARIRRRGALRCFSDRQRGLKLRCALAGGIEMSAQRVKGRRKKVPSYCGPVGI